MTAAPSTIFSPDFKTAPYWWDAAVPETTTEALPQSTDIVIVGSGYCGLTAAVELARNGKSVTVLDKGPLGDGASTRSGGMVSSGQKMVVTGAVKGLDATQVSRLLSESLESFTYLKSLIHNNMLDADLQLYGRFFGAYTPRHFERLQAQGKLLREKTGVTVHVIPRERQREVLGSDYYYGGIVVDEYGGLHVGKYHKSLRRLARTAGAQLHSHAGVERIERSGSGFRVLTPRGTLEAQHVILATNGYTGPESPYLHRRIIPVTSYQIATAPLPPDLMQQLNPGLRMISDSQRNLYYIRPSPDGTRMLLGSRPVILDTDERTAAVKLHRALLRIYPDLAGIPITHSWKGFVGMTFDKRAHIGQTNGLHYAVGCNGNGVALMTYLGHRIAREVISAAGDSSSAFATGELPGNALYRGNPWIVPPATVAYELGDTWDRLQRR